MTYMEQKKSCANCRRHRAEKQPKVIGEAFDTLVEFADEDETVYHCTVTNKRVGTLPIFCEHYEEPPVIASQLDDWEARFMARQGTRSEEL